MGKRLQNISNETRIVRVVRPNQTVVRTVEPTRFITLTDEEFNFFLDPPIPLSSTVWAIIDTGTEPPPPSPIPGASTTDDLPEGLINKYFLDGRAKAATIDNSINPLVTDRAPSQAAVSAALVNNGTGVNVGVGTGQVFKTKTLTGDLEFRTIAGGAGVIVTQVGDEIEIANTGSSGEANTASNRGTAAVGKAEVFAQKVGVNLEFKRLQQGTDIAINQDTNTITIASSTQVAEVTLTPAQLANLNATPINLVAAPGSGFSIVVESVELFLNFNSTAYSGSGDLLVEYSVSAPILEFAVTGFLQAGSAQRRFKLGNTDFEMLLENNLVRIRSTGAISGGDSPLKAKVKYKTISVLS